MARNLHEIIACIPEFIETTKQAEDAALEKKEIEDAKNLLTKNQAEDDPILTEVYGRYLLENIYDLSDFQDTMDAQGNVHKGRFSKSCRVFKCLEQDDSG